MRRAVSPKRSIVCHHSVGGPAAKSAEDRAVQGLKALITYVAVRGAMKEAGAPEESVERLKEHIRENGLRDGTAWLREILTYEGDEHIRLAARRAVDLRKEYAERQLDYEMIQHVARARADKEAQRVKSSYMERLEPDQDEAEGSGD